jgi:hypothetical protein
VTDDLESTATVQDKIVGATNRPMTMTGDRMLPALEMVIMQAFSDRQAELRLFLVVALQRGERDTQQTNRFWERNFVLKQGN